MQTTELHIDEIVSPYIGKTGGLITAIRAIQDTCGQLPHGIEVKLADVFNLSKAEVLGIISFYSDFRRAPQARHTIRLCVAEACQALSGRELQQSLEDQLNVTLGQKTDVEDVALEHVFCLGLCSRAPAAMVDGRLIGSVTKDKVLALVAGGRDEVTS